MLFTLLFQYILLCLTDIRFFQPLPAKVILISIVICVPYSTPDDYAIIFRSLGKSLDRTISTLFRNKINLFPH